jgi:phage-related protein
VPEKRREPRKLVWLVDSLDRAFQQRSDRNWVLHCTRPRSATKHESAKILRDFAETVWQVRADDPGGTYRAVYVAQLGDSIYVLHAFQKKAKSGIATPQRELDLIRQRLQLARTLAGKRG